MTRIGRLLLILIALPALGGWSLIARPEAGVIVSCVDEAEPGARFDSRAAVIWTPDSSGREVLVASGHSFRAHDGGLRDCRARTARGSARIETVILPEPDSGDDWAVATLAKRFDGPVRRWRLPEETGGAAALIEPGGRLTLFATEAGRDCHSLGAAAALPGGESAPAGSMIHDCPEAGGASGAPLTAEIGGEARLVAVYIGRMSGDGTGELGVARPLTDSFAEAVRVAAASN